MRLCLDTGYALLHKAGEELCGDTVEIINTGDSYIVVLSDGLGSGVKANILSQITTRIASTMLQKGSKIEEVIETLASTLPVCQLRKLAYSTFTILQVFHDGRVYLAEYDNPEIFWLKNKKICCPPRKEKIIEERTINESRFYVADGDWLVLVSDGVLHAGLGLGKNC